MNTDPSPSKSKFPLVLLVVILLFLFGSVGLFLARPILSPKPIVLPTTTADSTASWKTYVNTKYNFSLKYPPEWQVTSLPGTEVTTSNAPRFSSSCNFEKDQLCSTVLVLAAIYNPQSKIYEGDTVFDTSNGQKITNETLLKLDNENARGFKYFSRIYGGIGSLQYIVTAVHGDTKYTVMYEEPKTKKEITQTTEWENIKILDQILSTFKFTDQNSSNLSKTSPDASYTVTETMVADYNTIVVKDSSGKVITDDLIKKNEKAIGYGTKFNCQCGTSFAGWTDSSHFILKIVNGNGEEYQYTVDASTGIVNEASFKKVK